MKDQKLKITITPDHIDIYRKEKGKESVSVVCWHKDEWEEDPDTVLPAISSAIELYLTNQIRLLQILGLHNLVIYDEPDQKPKRKYARKIDYANHGLKMDGCDFI